MEETKSRSRSRRVKNESRIGYMRRRKQRIDEHFSYKCVRRILKRLAYVIVFDELFGQSSMLNLRINLVTALCSVRIKILYSVLKAFSERKMLFAINLRKLPLLLARTNHRFCFIASRKELNDGLNKIKQILRVSRFTFFINATMRRKDRTGK